MPWRSSRSARRLKVAAAGARGEEKIEPVKGSVWMNREDWPRSWKPWLRGTLIGFPIGAMPAGGAEIGTFLSYSIEKRWRSSPEEFGKGAIEGVAGPEAANNASAAGTLVPLLTLGLPTTATAAIMLAGFQQYRLAAGAAALRQQPGPGVGPDRQPVHRQPDAAGPEPAADRALGAAAGHPAAWLYAGILIFATLGTIGANPSLVELGHAAASSACSATGCAASAIRSRRSSSA